MIAALLLASLLSRQCVEIDDDRVHARHLRERVPEFQQLPADAVFGLAPRPGVRRLLPAYELSAFARKNLISLTDAREFCMIRTSMVLTAERMQQLLAASFQAFAASEGPVTVELIDFMKTAVPTGTVEFLKGGISRSDLQGTRLWRGSIVSPGGSRYPIWVRVRLQQDYKIVVAQGTIAPGSSISETQVAVETRRMPYQESAAFFADQALVAGRTAIRQIQDGQAVLRKDIVAAREIQAGDTVAVTAFAGAAHLTLEAKAETAGLRGGSILLKNPLSGKKFRATVIGPGHASVQGLVHAN